MLGVLIAILCSVVGFGHVVLAQKKPATILRDVRVVVLGLDGKPAPNRTARLIGLSRGSTRPFEASAAAAARVSGWDFQTDKDGQFIVVFGEFKSWEDKAGRPGWGNYALIVDPSPFDAGAVSPYIVHQTDPVWGRDANEWGKPLRLPPNGLDVTLQIKKGVTLKGRFSITSIPKNRWQAWKFICSTIFIRKVTRVMERKSSINRFLSIRMENFSRVTFIPSNFLWESAAHGILPLGKHTG